MSCINRKQYISNYAYAKKSMHIVSGINQVESYNKWMEQNETVAHEVTNIMYLVFIQMDMDNGFSKSDISLLILNTLLILNMHCPI